MHFVIAGSINCSQFTYAVMVAQRLKEHLPDFTYVKLAKRPEEYKNWLITTCKENHWYHVQSPIIWREIGLKNGKRDFIGDINKFLDLCYDYYGIPQEILSAEQFNKGEIEWFTKRTESEYFETVKMDAKQMREFRSRQVCITGASSTMTEVIIMELMQLKNQRRENGLIISVEGRFITTLVIPGGSIILIRHCMVQEIRLFDEPTRVRRLRSAKMDARCCPGPSGFGNCRIAPTLKEALLNVDLVIVLDAFMRKTSESLVKWLKRNRNAMCALGKALNKYAPAHCRVILGGPSNQPLCYNATVLASFATRLHVRNIVAVTQDLGRQTLKLLSAKTKTPMHNFYCPPVWGFVGLNKYVDIRKTLQTYLYKVPGKRLDSSIPQGREEYELRTCECMMDEEDEAHLLKTVSGRRADIFPLLGRWPCLAKATAIIDLLKVWSIKQEDGNGEILCLGVYSDGAFNIPQGIYWSQPVILKNGFWVPFEEYPIPRSPYFSFYYLFIFSVAALYRTKVKPRIYIPPKKKQKSREKHKFDFDKLAEAIGMPVIRTDVECVSYLKYLTKTELGIDLDASKDYIEEEEEEEEVEPEIIPPEEVVKKQIFCECWRQELKELQKVVFEHSTTTEIEMDLSDNVSGSEWSVVNVPSESQNARKGGNAVTKTITRTAGGEFGAGGDAENYSREDQTVAKKSTENMGPVSSGSTVCSCGLLPTGSVCKCLGAPESENEQSLDLIKSDEEKISTEHFYKEQNATIFEEDLKDVIYEDTFPAEKRATFEGGSKEEDGPGSMVKFYGQEDSIKDTETQLKMQGRISKYMKHEGELSSVEGEKSSRKEERRIMQRRRTSSTVSTEGEEEGEYLKEIRPFASRRGSSLALEGEHALSVSKVTYDSEKSEDAYRSTGEDQYPTSTSYYGTSPGLPGEKSMGEYSDRSLEEDLYGIWGESSPYGLFDREEETVTQKKRRKGIPLCCLCRCLIPEGLTVCPCGETTIVEVFKKESIEVFIQNEDDVDYIVDYYEKASTTELDGELPSQTLSSLSLSASTSRSASYSLKIDFDAIYSPTKTVKKELPPESFFPFSPKSDNKFHETTRPFQLTKEYIDSLNKDDTEIPPKCAELLDNARMKFGGGFMGGEGEESEYEYKEIGGETTPPPPICDEADQIKTDFSDLKMFVPCGLEDWRVTVQRKYREWFFQGPKIKDETYYDVAIEDISEDEFELDKDLEKYFEC